MYMLQMVVYNKGPKIATLNLCSLGKDTKDLLFPNAIFHKYINF
jgi:hypothetical protein